MLSRFVKGQDPKTEKLKSAVLLKQLVILAEILIHAYNNTTIIPFSLLNLSRCPDGGRSREHAALPRFPKSAHVDVEQGRSRKPRRSRTSWSFLLMLAEESDESVKGGGLVPAGHWRWLVAQNLHL